MSEHHEAELRGTTIARSLAAFHPDDPAIVEINRDLASALANLRRVVDTRGFDPLRFDLGAYLSTLWGTPSLSDRRGHELFVLGELAVTASDDHLSLVTRLLQQLAGQSSADAAWSEQVGPSLTQADTARLLGVSVQAISKNPHLLRVETRRGQPVYPVFQFHGGRQIDGVADVVRILRPALREATIASWLTFPQRSTELRRPVDALIAGDVDLVLDAATGLAEAAA